MIIASCLVLVVSLFVSQGIRLSVGDVKFKLRIGWRFVIKLGIIARTTEGFVNDPNVTVATLP